MQRQFFSFALLGSLLIAGSQLAACSDDEAQPLSRTQFCEDWAAAACSDDTVSACQASGADDCRLAQAAYCQMLVPATFSGAQADGCIDAVRAAYDDADLTGVEVDTVRRLGGDCARIVTGTREVGQSCDTDADCDGSRDAECVRHGGQESGTCQVPEEVGPGQSCAQPQQTCPDGFHCDGSNCIAALPVNAPCERDAECAPAGYCGADDECVARLPVGSACVSDNECQSLLCYGPIGDRGCADLVRLSPSEELCDELR